MNKLQEKRSLVRMAEALGQTPDPALLEDIVRLEALEARIKKNIAKDLNEIFTQPTISETKVDEIIENIAILEEPVLITRIAIPESNPEVIAEVPTVAEQIAKSITRQLSTNEGTLVRPDAEMPAPNAAIEQKIKYLENWISRIAATGPGSGEVNFRWLDDVNRATINDNWVLEYDAPTKKFQFTKNVGPLESVKFDTSGTTQTSVAGLVAWNPVEDCLDIHQSDTSKLQVGLEQYIRVYNNTTSSLYNGHLMFFNDGSIVNADEVPTAGPYLANGTITPVDVIGLCTNDIAISSIGRITTFGKVRNLNTTGADVGETWKDGEILWASPTSSGHLTKVQPTAPNIQIKVGRVLRAHSSLGVIFVKPIIFPVLRYGVFSDTTDQYVSSTNTGVAIRFNTTDIANGHHIGSGVTSRIYAEHEGLYNYKFSVQIVSTNSSTKNIWVWPRKNGQDIPNSATRLSVSGNNEYEVAAWDFTISMNIGNYFELIWAADDVTTRLDAPPATVFCPAIPSVILTVSQVAL